MRTGEIRKRVIAVFALPVVLAGCISTWTMMSLAERELTEQSRQFGQAIADQLADTAVDYLVSSDVLSLNVILDELFKRHNFDFAAVYNGNNDLLAQTGRRSPDQPVYSRGINFSDTNLGYVQVVLDRGPMADRLRFLLVAAVSVHIIIVMMFAAFIWFYGDLAWLWLSRAPAAAGSASSETPRPKPPAEPTSEQRTVLSVKLKPARLFPRKDLESAASLYGGVIEPLSNEEWLFTFNSQDQVLKAMLCGLLIDAVVRLKPGNLKLRMGIDHAPLKDIGIVRKRVSYIASLSEHHFLITRSARTAIKDRETPGIAVEPFHNSRTGEGEVFEVTTRDPLIEQQARQLITASQSTS